MADTLRAELMLSKRVILHSVLHVYVHSRVNLRHERIVSQTVSNPLTGPEKTSTQKIDVRHDMDLRKTFAAALGNMQPDEHQEMPGVDAPWYWEYSKKNGGYTDPFPGLLLRKVNMERFNADKPPLERRNLKYYAVRGSMPSVQEDPNMHICAHLYASDRNSLFVMFVSSYLSALFCATNRM